MIDVGGGASPLSSALLDRGFRDLTVLDISPAGMQHARDRLGSRAGQVHWLTADVLSWHPPRHYQAWHDRAVYHFQTVDKHRQQYLGTLDAATSPGAIAVFGSVRDDRAYAFTLVSDQSQSVTGRAERTYKVAAYRVIHG